MRLRAVVEDTEQRSDTHTYTHTLSHTQHIHTHARTHSPLRCVSCVLLTQSECCARHQWKLCPGPCSQSVGGKMSQTHLHPNQTSPRHPARWDRTAKMNKDSHGNNHRDCKRVTYEWEWPGEECGVGRVGQVTHRFPERPIQARGLRALSAPLVGFRPLRRGDHITVRITVTHASP